MKGIQWVQSVERWQNTEVSHLLANPPSSMTLSCWLSVLSWFESALELLLLPLHIIQLPLQYWHEHVLCNFFLLYTTLSSPMELSPVDTPLSHRLHSLCVELIFSKRFSTLSLSSLMPPKVALFFLSRVSFPLQLQPLCNVSRYLFLSRYDKEELSVSDSSQLQYSPAAWWLQW